MAKGNFRCEKCDRDFSMAAHLARHNSTIHGLKKKKKVKKKAARRGRPPKKKAARRGRPPKKKVARRGRPPKKKAARRGRPPKRRAGSRVGRPRGVAGRLHLNSLTLDQLSELLVAAKELALRKLDDLKASLG